MSSCLDGIDNEPLPASRALAEALASSDPTHSTHCSVG